METTKGQKPLTTPVILWIMLLIVLWAANSVIVKVSVSGFPPMFTALMRFGMAFPIAAAFILTRIKKLSINRGEFFKLFLLGILSGLQIFTFNYGAQFTTGGRITLFIFTYPLMIAFFSPLIVKTETFSARVLWGSLIAFAGLLVPLRDHLVSFDSALLKGDLTELLSAVILTVVILYNKRLMLTINRWKIFFWRYLFMVLFFLAGTLLLEDWGTRETHWTAWAAVFYQTFVVSVFCFLSFQYILSNHNSAKISVFFFATPLLGMLIGILLLGEKADASLFAGCLLVGLGIFAVNWKKTKK